MSVAEGVKDADIIVLASPVHSIPSLVKEAVRHAKNGAVITDVGSTKEWIVKSAESLVRKNKKIYFVGSHPMAGSEHAGVEYSRSDLLEGTPCIVTKTPGTDRRSLAKISDFWRSLGAHVSIMSPSGHDRSVSFIIHMPHIVAFSLAASVPAGHLKYAAEGFKDTTRVASSDPKLWADIFLTNKKEIARSGKAFVKNYSDLIRSIAAGDYGKVVSILRKANTTRDMFINGKEH
jgi:prephenate dehydrogenase